MKMHMPTGPKPNYDLDLLNWRSDERWAHPEIIGPWTAQETDQGFYEKTFNPAIPAAERDAATKASMQVYIDMMPPKDPNFIKHYEFDGYEIETAWGRATVARPKDLPLDKKTPVIFAIPAGGLSICLDTMVPEEMISGAFGATVVIPTWRCIFDEGGQYPGTIDDLDNVYKWMLDNADELHINTNRIVIWGESSGGHLALALCHRLKNKENPYYGKMPRGCIAFEPITDDRTVYLNSKRACPSWDSDAIHASAIEWLGYEWMNPAYTPAEAFANHATPEECVGLPPTIIHTGDAEPCVDSQMEYVGKLIRAGVYASIHVWGGCDHSALHNPMKSPENLEIPYINTYWSVLQNDVKNFLKYDLRRSFVKKILAGEEQPRVFPQA